MQLWMSFWGPKILESRPLRAQLGTDALTAHHIYARSSDKGKNKIPFYIFLLVPFSAFLLYLLFFSRLPFVAKKRKCPVLCYFPLQIEI
jgi:hypothetical protein